MPIGLLHSYHLNELISSFRVGACFSPFLFKLQYSNFYANCKDPTQRTHAVASQLDLHCLSISHKKDACPYHIKGRLSI